MMPCAKLSGINKEKRKKSQAEKMIPAEDPIPAIVKSSSIGPIRNAKTS